MEWNLFDHFEWMVECQKHGIGLSDFNAMMPWHMKLFIDTRNMKIQEELDKKNNK